MLHYLNTWCRAVLSSTHNKLVAAEVTIAHRTETKNTLIFKYINIRIQSQRNGSIPNLEEKHLEYKAFLSPPLQKQLKKCSNLGLIGYTQKLHEDFRLNQTASLSF